MQTELEFPHLQLRPRRGPGHGGVRAAGQTVGRAEEVQQVQEYADRRQDSLVLGPAGVGKSHLLSVVRGPRIVRIRSLSPARQTLLQIAEDLFEAGALRAQAGVAGRAAKTRPSASARPAGPAPAHPDFPAFLKQHTRTTVYGWTRLVTQAVPPRQWLLIVDDVSGLTRVQGQLLDQLGERFAILAAAIELPRAERRRFARFKRVQLANLCRKDATQLMRQRLAGARMDNPRLAEAYLWHQSVGNPRALVEMIEQLRREPAITEDAARNLEYPGARPQLDLTPIILIPAVFLVAARFVARGLGDTEAYILAGVGAALVMGLQFLLFRLRR
jgi:hypothetical protein